MILTTIFDFKKAYDIQLANLLISVIIVDFKRHLKKFICLEVNKIADKIAILFKRACPLFVKPEDVYDAQDLVDK